MPRDYKGLASQLGFSYADVKICERSADPMKVLLEQLEKVTSKECTKTFQHVLDALEEIERYDVIDDILESLTHDMHYYTARLKQLRPNELTPIAESSIRYPDKIQPLTIHDVMMSQSVFYDAYVCYADEDYAFAQQLSNRLETTELGIRLLMRDRDLLLGAMEQDSIMKLIETRCRRIIIVLSPEFLLSSQCEFQTRFATGIAIEQRHRKIIPVIYKSCKLPDVIRFLTKIDLSKDDQSTSWNWRKLVLSIQDTAAHNMKAPMFLPTSTMPMAIGALPLNDSTKMLKATNTRTYLPSATNSLSITEISDSLPIYSDLPSPIISEPSSTLTSNLSSNFDNPSSTKQPKKSWIKSIKQKITGSTTYAQLNS